MLKKLLPFFIACSFSVLAEEKLDQKFASEQAKQIRINNRILTVVNGKAITLLDLVKNMDVLFHNQYPEYASNPAARFQYYQSSWQAVFRDLLDKEFIKADAKEKKLTVEEGELREQMEGMFGPKIMERLDQIGLTYEEAKEMIANDIIIQRMLMHMVGAKAQSKITPELIHKAYLEKIEEMKQAGSWKYRFISIRAENDELCQTTAKNCEKILKDEPLDNLVDKYKEKFGEPKEAKISISKTLLNEQTALSQDFLTALQNLKENDFSKALKQKSRSNKQEVYRIFQLIEHKTPPLPSLTEAEGNIRKSLLQRAQAKESENYLNKLYKHYGFDLDSIEKLLPKDFEPFVLVQ